MLGRTIRRFATLWVFAIFFSTVLTGVSSISHGQIAPYHWANMTNKAAWLARDGAGGVVLDGKMWLLGGWNPSIFPKICTNDVWNSTDGVTWNQIKANTFIDGVYDPNTDWEGRHTGGYVVHQDKMWIVGGDPNQGHYQYDVWNSSDGVTWTHVNKNKPVPWGPRILQYTTVFDGKIWIMGGQTTPQVAPAAEAFYNDVWNSIDGVNWTQVNDGTASPMWSPRGMIQGSVEFNERMWFLGGGTYDTPGQPDRNFYNEVWSSADGVDWRMDTVAPWAARQYHSVAVFDDKIWVMAGANFDTPEMNRNDVWYSSDGVNWTELPNTPWPTRHAGTVMVHDNALWMVGGSHPGSSPINDVWKLVRGPGEQLTSGKVDFEAEVYVAGSTVAGVDGWSSNSAAATTISSTSVLEGTKSQRIDGSGGATTYTSRRFVPGTIYGDGTTIRGRMMVDGSSTGTAELFLSHNMAASATPAGIIAQAGGNFFVYGMVGGALATASGWDSGVAVVSDADYLLELELDLTNQSFESFVTNLSAGGSRTSLGTYDFAYGAGDSIGPEDIPSSGYFLVTRGTTVAIYDELDLYNTPGDANADGVVDAADAAILAANWQTMAGATWSQGNFNNDGKVDDLDATIMAVNWSPVPFTAVPEPSLSIALLGLFIGCSILR